MVKQYALMTERYLFDPVVVSQDFLFNTSTTYQTLTILRRILLLLLATPFILAEMIYLRSQRQKIRPSWSFRWEVFITFTRLFSDQRSSFLRGTSSRAIWQGLITPFWLDPRPDILAGDSLHPDVPPERVPCFWFRYGNKEQRQSRLDIAAHPNERVVLYLVGGGYITTSPSYFNNAWNLSKATNTRVLAVNYRKAVGLKRQAFPAALQDALAGYFHLLDLGFKSENISVIGDSAGGGLTMTLCLHLRDRNLPMPRSMVLISPWVDLTMSLGKSLKTNHSSDYICQEMCRTGCALYGLNNPSLLKSPLLSPAILATGKQTHLGKPYDLKGLPRALIFAGEAEILVDEISMLVEVLERDNGSDKVRYVIEPDAVHVYPTFEYLPQAKAAMTMLGKFAFA